MQIEKNNKIVFLEIEKKKLKRFDKRHRIIEKNIIIIDSN